MYLVHHIWAEQVTENKMADNKDIVGGIFGITPELYQQAKEQQQLAEAERMGKLTPEQFIGTQAYRGGQMLGNVASGLLGVEDPQLQAIRGAQSIVNKYDISTSRGLKQVTQELQKLAQDTGNNAYLGMAQDAAKKYKETLLNEATVSAKLREQVSGFGKLVRERDAIAAENPNDPRIAEYNKMIAAEQEGKGTKFILPGEQQGKELRTANVKQYVDLGDRALTAGTTLQTVTDMNNLINKAFVGVGAGAKLNAAQVANALGISVTGTTESEQLDQLFSALTIGQAKNLKGALSDKDVKFLKEAVGSRGLTKDTLAAVVNRISRDAQVDDLTYQKATEYKSGGGDLADFDFVKAKKEAMADINEKAAKQRRLEELRKKAKQ